MGRKRTSIIWSISFEVLSEIVKNNFTYSAILRELNLPTQGRSQATLIARIQQDKISSNHIESYKISGKSRLPKQSTALPLESVLVENSTYSRTNLKPRLLRLGLLEHKCYECGIKDLWNGKKLSLQLDHINGVRNDNRIENLRILCPNCHSQTANFSGKNRRIFQKVKCDIEVPKLKRIHSRKVIKPSKEDLEKLLWKMPSVQIAEQYGVSDSAVKKWAESYGLSKPSRGYWSKKRDSLTENQ